MILILSELRIAQLHMFLKWMDFRCLFVITILKFLAWIQKLKKTKYNQQNIKDITYFSHLPMYLCLISWIYFWGAAKCLIGKKIWYLAYWNQKFCRVFTFQMQSPKTWLHLILLGRYSWNSTTLESLTQICYMQYKYLLQNWYHPATEYKGRSFRFLFKIVSLVFFTWGHQWISFHCDGVCHKYCRSFHLASSA